MREIIDISPDFFEILEVEDYDLSKSNILYGGNQAWFEEHIFQATGCGTIAATNVYINNFLNQKEGRIRISKEEYMDVARKLSFYVHPLHFFKIPIGIWPSSLFIKMMKQFMKSIGEKVEFSKFSPSSNTEFLTQKIVDSLHEGFPLFMLIGLTSRFKNMTLEYPNGQRVGALDASKHWVIILGLYEADGECYLKTSSWGGILYIKLSDWKKCWWPSKILRMKKGGRL